MDYLVQEKAKTWKLHLDRTQWQSVAKECPQKIERTTVVGCFYYRDFFDLRKKIGNDRKACIQVKTFVCYVLVQNSVSSLPSVTYAASFTRTLCCLKMGIFPVTIVMFICMLIA
jgi:hypothetical protein